MARRPPKLSSHRQSLTTSSAAPLNGRLLNRRNFLRSSVAGGIVLSMSPQLIRGQVLGANERLNLGIIGVGGRGEGNLAAVSTENIVALCDVDEHRLNAAAARFPQAQKYFDYRQLLEQQNLDAVVISTPDHHHAPATMRALRRDLHVYCEKPLTHTVAEARLIHQLSAQKKLATQMGTQNHEHPGYLRLVEWLQSNVIGAVHEVHVITDRPGGFWQQGMNLPTTKELTPEHLHWDLWLGPAAGRDYHPAFVPFRWRGWWDFGCGAIGDMAIHLADPAFWALELSGPVTVTSQGPPPLDHCGPTWMTTLLEFEARGKHPALKLFWYEGTAKPPAEIQAELPMNGSLFIGERGRIAIQHDNFPRLLPAEDFADFVPPEPFLPNTVGHHQQWIQACKTGVRTSCPFSYAAPFTEYVLLGNVAYRHQRPIQYDILTGKITNDPTANQWLSKSYRPGWEVN